jgi:hypothetical protein
VINSYLWIVSLEVPKQRSTFVANSSLYAILALAQFASGNRAAALETLGHASGIAIALLAQREVVESLLATLALDAVKVLGALAGALVVAGNSNGTTAVAIAS